MKTKIIIGLLLLVSLSSCVKNKTDFANEEYFFSLKNYFENEARRLSKEQPTILKEVKRNSSAEEKEMKIQNWEKEFGLFIESDINKISWKDSYQEIIHQDTLIYQSKDPKLRTQEIVIVKENKQIKEIFIKNIIENYLYSSVEELKYYPDSIYQINKKQDVILLGSNAYYIAGYFH
jgi:hypothetical protein